MGLFMIFFAIFIVLLVLAFVGFGAYNLYMMISNDTSKESFKNNRKLFKNII